MSSRGRPAGLRGMSMLTTRALEASYPPRRDRRGRAAEGAGDLAMSRPGLQTGGDGDQELRTLQVEGDGEALPGKGATTGGATEPGHGAAPPGAVGSMMVETCPAIGTTMGRAIGP